MAIRALLSLVEAEANLDGDTHRDVQLLSVRLEGVEVLGGGCAYTGCSEVVGSAGFDSLRHIGRWRVANHPSTGDPVNAEAGHRCNMVI